jgi:hypothetical protein
VSRAARFTPVLALLLAVTLGVWILFGPTYTTCSITAAPGQPQSAEECHSENLIAAQGGDLFPAPLLWIAAWSLAPALAVIGTRTGSRTSALVLTGVAFAIDAMSIISMGGGFVYALGVAPLLLLTLVLIARDTVDSARPALG